MTQPKQPPSNLTDEELENHYYLTGEVEKAALMRRIINLKKGIEED